MAMFVEVGSMDKQCKVIINLDSIHEIAPLASGGCALFLTDGGLTKVTDSYDQFKQFAMQTVSSEDIAKKVKSLKGSTSTLEIPKL
jgi:hypothetical protein